MYVFLPPESCSGHLRLCVCSRAGDIEHLTVVDSSPALLAATKEALEAEAGRAGAEGAAGIGGEGAPLSPSNIQFVASTPGELLPVDPQ